MLRSQEVSVKFLWLYVFCGLVRLSACLLCFSSFFLSHLSLVSCLMPVFRVFLTSFTDFGNWTDPVLRTFYPRRVKLVAATISYRRKVIKSNLFLHFYYAMLCIRGTSHGPVSVCLSVSVTSWSSTKTAKRRITQTTPHNSPGTLVFWCQRSPRNSTGVTPYKGSECRWGGSKSVTFDKWPLYLENGKR